MLPSSEGLATESNALVLYLTHLKHTVSYITQELYVLIGHQVRLTN